MRLSPCYYGDRKVIYVQVTNPTREDGQKSVSVYGHSLRQVLLAIDAGLTKAFGKTGAGRPKGRPKGRK